MESALLNFDKDSAVKGELQSKNLNSLLAYFNKVLIMVVVS